MSHLKQAQERYKQAVRKAQYSGQNLPHNDSILVSTDSLEAEDLNKPLSQFVESASRNNSLQLLNPFRSSDPDSVSMTSQLSTFSTADTVCTTLSDSTQTFSSQASPTGSPKTSPLLNDSGSGGPQGEGEGSMSPLLPGSPLHAPREDDDMTVTSAGAGGGLVPGQQTQQHLSPPRSPYNSVRNQRWKLKAIHEKSISKDTVPLTAGGRSNGGVGGGGRDVGSGGESSAFSEPTDV